MRCYYKGKYIISRKFKKLTFNRKLTNLFDLKNEFKSKKDFRAI